MAEETKKEKKPTRFRKMFAVIHSMGADKDKVHAYLRKAYGMDHLSGLSDDKVEQMIKRLEDIAKDPFELEVFKGKVEKGDNNVKTGMGEVDDRKVEGVEQGEAGSGNADNNE